ncbi:MAG: hypothetical protein LUE06_08010 [Oscillospiraceae bacterium]|nr:hypothetical protein [Oscillospiraceae bacterium]
MTARRNLKRAGALVLALAMCFALGATALADTDVGTYSVTIYQDGTTTKSMADGCMGDATVTLSGTTYTVSIPLTTITMTYGDSTYVGKITDIEIEQATKCSAEDDTLVFTVSSDDFAELTFDATMSVTVTAISGSGGYTHDNVAADIVLSK